MRILLTEDEAELRELLAANLRRSGFAVDLSATLDEAEAALATTRYDIIPSIYACRTATASS
jgi:DNA-binding response OmpR family regulator